MYSNRRRVSEKEKMRVHQLASRHTSSVPSLLMTMQPTHVYMGQLVFSKVQTSNLNLDIYVHKWIRGLMAMRLQEVKNP